jgi:hypothetical protein
VLVVPEGIVSEASLLFSCVDACARRLPHYTFLLRCHPQVPMAEALAAAPARLTSHPNVVISDRRSIEEDFARSSVILYRRSSTVLYGILHGLLPVHMRLTTTTINEDPLYQLNVWRQSFATPEELATLLERYDTAPQHVVESEWRGACAYARGYTVTVDDRAVGELLAAVGLEPHGAEAASAAPGVR